MAANDRNVADQGGVRPRVYPVSLQQAAAAIFGITSLGEQSRAVPSEASIQPEKPTGKISENQ